MNKEDIREIAEENAIYEFNKFKKIYGNYTDEYVRHFYNKLAELRSGIDDVHTCNCKYNSNSRENEPCCRCDSRHTNADRIRNMSDEELAETIHSISCNATEISTCKEECLKCEQPDSYCVRKIMEWLQSEAEQERIQDTTCQKGIVIKRRNDLLTE